MSKNQKHLTTFILSFLILCFMGIAHAENECVNCNPDGNPVADVNVNPYGISFQPKVEFGSIILTVSRPDGTTYDKNFAPGSSLYLDLSGGLTDGVYSFELRVIPATGKQERINTVQSEGPVLQKAQIQSGTFTVKGGKILTAGTPEDMSKPMDVLHYDDVIITGSLCVGFDCVNGESFGYCTVKLKENNLQLCFEDTSTGTFPTNDWKIQINDTTSGGGSYFTLWDTDAGVRPFTIEAGAPAHSLYVEDYGRVGLGTSIPYVELHIVDGDSPTIRLDQDGSSGWTAQRWDLCGNETNFFLRDVTNGSKLCFRVQPNTPSNTLCLKSNGYVGIGTWSPEAQFEIEKTGENAAVIFQRTDGATGKFTARPSEIYMGTSSDHPVRIVANNNKIMTLESGGDVGIGGDNPSYKLQVWNDAGTAYGYSDGGAWATGSSRKFKENIKDLDAGEAMSAFMALNPVQFNYIGEKDNEQLGFIAEDVPELVAVQNRDAVSAMDIVTLLTKIVQEQQKTIAELKEKIEKIENK